MQATSSNPYVDTLNLLDKIVKLGSAIFPLVAVLLRKMGWIKRGNNPNPVVSVAGVIGFGCLGSIVGLFLLTILGIASIVYLSAKLAEWQSGGLLSFGSIDWGILGQLASKQNLICVGASIVTTLLTFGGKDQPKGLAFLAGGCLGATIAVFFLLSFALH
jgi:hypothetical protein